tara:strand:- start:157 stop:1962 length:1806 start_codon:yes stop_codon:yes gene_type:complete
MLISLLVIIPLQKYPQYLATSWRLKASNQMVLCVFYFATYMRHSSNMERAIEFAADHLDPPLSLDMKKILWDVENQKYDTVNEALDTYLLSWKQYSEEFVDAVHLLQSSLFEGTESRRLDLLDKALDVILEGTYEKMLHYAQNLKNPMTTLHMLGVILPILGLVILPLAVSFLENVFWWHLALLYNIILPIVVFFMGKSILASRPSGYGDSDISKKKALKKYAGPRVFGVTFSPLIIACIVGGILLFIGALPLMMNSSGFQDVCWDFNNPEFTCEVGDEDCLRTYCVLEYREVVSSTGVARTIGPFGFVASILSVFVPLALGIGFGLYYRMKTKNVLKIRQKTKKVEKEFSSALFQLGNRLGDGLPAEVAIPRVAEIMKESTSGKFFSLVTMNMQKMGMGLRRAVFDKKTGAILFFPSKIIDSAMKVLVESVQKGPEVAAQSMNNVARYIKEIHRVNERLKDLLADIISSMKQQISFLAPVISGVVVGITSMITFILGKLQEQSSAFSQGVEGAEGISNLLSLGAGMPSYWFQIVVGVYVVQIVFILTMLASSVENGEDRLGMRYALGKNLIRSTITYTLIALGVLLVFQLVAGQIIARTL